MKLNNYEAIEKYLTNCIDNIFSDNGLEPGRSKSNSNIVYGVGELIHDLMEIIGENTKTEPFNECFYTGGGIWVSVHQFGGDDYDMYCAIDNLEIGADDSEKSMTYYSHKEDHKGGYNEQYGLYGVVRYADYDEMNSAEREIYNILLDLMIEEKGC